jgi:hypothetical protein
MLSLLKSLSSSGKGRRAAGDPSRARRGRADRRTLRFEGLDERKMLSWTFMVYADAATDLGDSTLAQFQEMANVGSTADVDIVFQVASPGNTGGKTTSLFDGHADARRGRIERQDTLTQQWGTHVAGADVQDPATLANFVTWAINTYDPQKTHDYALVLSGHGGGIDGSCSLAMAELSTALDSLPQMALLAFDSCLMGTIEVAYQFRANASVFVASEELVANTGFDYQPFLEKLAGAPGARAEDLARDIVTSYAAYYEAHGDPTRTLAALDLSALREARADGPHAAVRQFSDLMWAQGTGADWIALWRARDAAQQFNATPATGRPYPGRDLVDVMARLRSTAGVSPEIAAAAGDVISAVEAAVLEKWAGAARTANGLSIYFPAPRDGNYAFCYATENLRFAADVPWKRIVDRVSLIDAAALDAGSGQPATRQVAPGQSSSVDVRTLDNPGAQGYVATVETVSPTQSLDLFGTRLGTSPGCGGPPSGASPSASPPGPGQSPDQGAPKQEPQPR